MQRPFNRRICCQAESIKHPIFVASKTIKILCHELSEQLHRKHILKKHLPFYMMRSLSEKKSELLQKYMHYVLYFVLSVFLKNNWHGTACNDSKGYEMIIFCTVTDARLMIISSGGYKGESGWMGGSRPPITGSTLKQRKILHKNALLWHKNFKNFPRRGHSPLPRPHPTLLQLIQNFWIRHW